jgi:release factor glutamine methyltransferase
MIAPMNDDAVIVTQLRTAGCVFAEDEARLLLEAAGSPAQLAAMVNRRVAGQPLEHILGWVEFRGRRLIVEPGVFVPRQRTGFLVEQAVRLAAPGAIVLDVCCGCGAIGAAIAAELGRVELHATDVDPAAVACARRNLPEHTVHQGDLFAALPPALRGRADLVVANVPYVPTEAIASMPPEAREHEPRTALDGGADGLTLLRRVTAEAPGWLAPGGHLLIETSREQAPAAQAAFAAHALSARMATEDELGATVVIGRKLAD